MLACVSSITEKSVMSRSGDGRDADSIAGAELKRSRIFASSAKYLARQFSLDSGPSYVVCFGIKVEILFSLSLFSHEYSTEDRTNPESIILFRPSLPPLMGRLTSQQQPTRR